MKSYLSWVQAAFLPLAGIFYCSYFQHLESKQQHTGLCIICTQERRRRRAVGEKHSFWLSGCKAKSFVFFLPFQIPGSYSEAEACGRVVSLWVGAIASFLSVPRVSPGLLPICQSQTLTASFSSSVQRLWDTLDERDVPNKRTITSPKSFVDFWGYTFKELSAQISVLENGDYRFKYQASLFPEELCVPDSNNISNLIPVKHRSVF